MLVPTEYVSNTAHSSYNPRIFGIFVDNLEKDMEQLQESFKCQSHQDWDDTAHKLYGSCSHMGAQALAAVCGQAQSVSPNDTGKIEALHYAILSEYERLYHFLKARKAA